MLDNKKIKEIENNVKRLLEERKIIKEDRGNFVEFFLNNSKNSSDAAKLLFDISTKEDLRKIVGFPNFNGFLWVINSAYYSMFYMARALLESEGIKIKTDLGIHSVVFNALVYYFYLTGKIERTIIEEFQEAGIEASEILGKEKAKEIVEDYFYEKDKRGRFTYEMGAIAIKNKAQTSLERAKKFIEEIRKLIEK